MLHLSNKIKAVLLWTLLTAFVYINKGDLEEYLTVIGIGVPIAMTPDSNSIRQSSNQTYKADSLD
jgi:hypothetical protein